MVSKIKAITEAERKGRIEVARLIAGGDIPPEAILGVDLLTPKEYNNPLLTQFAAKAAEMQNCL